MTTLSTGQTPAAGWAGRVIHAVIRGAREIDAMQIGVKGLGTVPCRAERAGSLHLLAMTPL